MQKNDIIIINNKGNGQWIKLTKECYNIIKIAIEKEYSKIELLNKLYDKEDRNYIEDLINKLEKLEILYESDNEKLDNIACINKISFAITDRCNLLCSHCSMSASPNNIDKISTEGIIESIDKIIKCNPKIFVITGGEPLIRKDFIYILDYIKQKYNNELGLMTNGTLITEENAEIIANSFESIAISMDGYDEKSCSNIRGKGVYEKIINGISLLNKYGQKKISLSMVLDKNNRKYKEEFKKLNQKLGTKCIFRKYAPIGRGYLNRNQHMELEEIYNYITPIKPVRRKSMKTNM